MSKHKPRDWPALENIAHLPQAVMDNHTHLPISPTEGPGAAAASGPLSAAQLVERAQVVGVNRMITSACELPAFAPSLELARQLPGVKVALAIHPNEAVLHVGVSEVGPDGLQPRFEAHHGAYDLDAALAQVERACRENPEIVVAVGETGMDLFRTGPRGGVAQRESFRAHIALAKELGLPLQIHDRQAHRECIEVLLADGAPERTVFHCFSGDEAMAQVCAEHGWYASVSGPVTYKSNRELRAAIAAMPQQLLLIETDAPYLPPTPYRGMPNGSYLLPVTLTALAQLRQLSLEQMCQLVNRNSREVYGF